MTVKPGDCFIYQVRGEVRERVAMVDQLIPHRIMFGGILACFEPGIYHVDDIQLKMRVEPHDFMETEMMWRMGKLPKATPIHMEEYNAWRTQYLGLPS